MQVINNPESSIWANKIDFKEIINIWQFINHYFGYCYPFDFIPEIQFSKFSPELFPMRVGGNEMELRFRKTLSKTQLKAYDNSVDAVCSVYIKKNSKEIHQIILIFTDRIEHTKVYKQFRNLGYSKKNYIEFILIHELTHALEHLTHKQLLKTHNQDCEMFIEYHQKP